MSPSPTRVRRNILGSRGLSGLRWRVLTVLCVAVAMLAGATPAALALQPTFEELRSIAFVDGDVGYAVGAEGGILKTTNGGTDWEIVRQSDWAYDFRGVSATGTQAWAVGRNGQLVRSLDMGATWQEVTDNVGYGSLQTAMLNSVEGMSSGKVFAAGTAMEGTPPLLYVSNTAGYQFPLANLRKGNTYFDAFDNPVGLGEFYDIELVGDSHVWAVGHDDFDDPPTDHNDGVIWEYNGASWEERKNLAGTGPLYGVSFGSPDWGIAVGQNGQVQYTIDGGVTWNAGDSGTYEHLYAVAAGTMGQAWAVGEWGTTLVTFDYGATWISLYNPAGMRLYDVAATGGTQAVAVGEFGTIVRTTDGLTWEFPPSYLGNPSIIANPSTDEVSGSGWMPSSLVNVGFPGGVNVLGFCDPAGTFTLDPADVPDFVVGDVITAAEGLTNKTLILDPNFAITSISPSMDTMAGTVAPGYAVTVGAQLPTGAVTLPALVTPQGTWTVDFDSQGLNLQPGQTGTATSTDSDGDMYVQGWTAPASNPTLIVNLTSDTFTLSDWAPGANITLTVFDGPTQLWQTTVPIDATGRANGEMTGFDAQGGQIVVAAAPGGTPSRDLYLDDSVIVTQVDSTEDVVVGQAPGYAPVVVGKYSGTPAQRLDVMADNYGNWSVDSTLAWDIAPGDTGYVLTREPDGDATAVSWAAPGPVVVVNPWTNDVWLENWDPIDSVALSVDVGEGDPFTTSLPTDVSGNAHTVLDSDLDISSAVITATDGVTTKEVTVDPAFAVKWAEPDTNRVIGRAAPNTTVSGEMVGDGWTTYGAASTQTGDWWFMSFDPTEHDLGPDSSGTVSVTDPDFDRVTLGWYVSDPRIRVDDNNNVWVEGFSPKAEVGIFVGSSSDRFACPWQVTIPTDASGAGNGGIPIQLLDGMYVHAYYPTPAGEHRYVQISDSTRITEVNDTADTVSGFAPPNREVLVWVGTQTGRVETWTTSNGDGSWTATFTNHNLIPGDEGAAEVYEADGDAQMVWWRALDSRVWADPGNDIIGGDEWDPATPVSVSVDGDGNPGTSDVVFTGSLFVGANGAGQLDLGAFDLLPGQYVTAVQATRQRVLQVGDLQVLSVDTEIDEVYGHSGIDAQIDVFVEDGFVSAMPSQGSWTAMFAGVRDIQPHDVVTARLDDGDGDWTQTSYEIPNPRIWVDPTDNLIGGDEWPEGMQVNVAVYPDVFSQTPLWSGFFVAEENGYGEVPEDQLNGFDIMFNMDVRTTSLPRNRQMRVADLGIYFPNENTDEITGYCYPGGAVSVWVDEVEGAVVETTTDTYLNWAVDFTGIHDIGPGDGGQAEYLDPDGDATRARWYVPNPRVWADPTTDQIGAEEWIPGQPVTIAIDGDGNPLTTWDILFERTINAGPDGSLSLNAEDFAPLDLQPGHFVHASDGVVTKTLEVIDLIAQPDPVSDMLSGNSTRSGELEVDQFDVFQTTINVLAYEPWSVSIPDLSPGDEGFVRMADPDGDDTRTHWRVPDPRVWANPTDDVVGGDEWPANQEVVVQVQQDSDPWTADELWWGTFETDAQGNGWADLGGFDLQPGQMVIAEFPGSARKWVVVSDLSVQSADALTDDVTGFCGELGELHAWADDSEALLTQFHDVFGTFTLDFSAVYDIQPGSTGQVELPDADGDSTRAGWRAPNPRVWADPSNDTFGWDEFAEGAPVNVTIDLDGNPLTFGDNLHTYSFAAGQHFAEFPGDLQPNMFVTAQQMDTTKQLVVVDLQVTGFSDVSDDIWGSCAGSGQVSVWAHEGEGSVTANIIAGGWWTSLAPYDIVPGSAGSAEYAEPDGDATRADWRVPAPRVWADPTSDSIGGDEWPAGATVNITADHDGNPITPDAFFFGAFTPDENGFGEVPAEQLLGLDLAAGDFVTAQCGPTTKTLQIADFSITDANSDDDSVSGSSGMPGRINVRAHEYDADVEFESLGGPWSADFTAQCDLLPGDAGHADLLDADGDATRAGWRMAKPVVFADVPEKRIGVEEFPPSADVQLTLDTDTDSGNGTLLSTTVTAGPDGFAEIDPTDAPQLANLVPGMYVTASSGSVNKSVLIQALSVTALHSTGGHVIGTAAPFATVDVRAYEDDVSVQTTASSGGGWSVLLGRDLLNGEMGRAEITDAEGDRTMATWQYWPPGIGADTLTDTCEAWGYPVGSSLTFTVDDDANAGNGVLYTWNGTVDETGVLTTDETFTFDIQAGMYVRSTDGYTPRELYAEDIRVTWVDAANNRMGGTAPAGRQLHMYTNDEIVGSFAADGSGDWTFDFGTLNPPIDIVPGSSGMVFDRDADYDNNLAYWRGDIAPPTTSVVGPQPTYPAIANITLSVTDDNDSTPTTWWKLDGGAWTAGTTLSTSVLGSHTLYYYSEDDSGNREAEKTFAFEVLDPKIRYEQDNSLIKYRGAWTTSTGDNYSGGSCSTGNSAETELKISFTGTAIDLIAYKGAHYGKAYVILDGGAPELIDLYSPNYAGRQVVWNATGLADTTHEVRFQWAGVKNASSSGYVINLDAADIVGTLLQAPTYPTRYEQDTSLISYRSTWASSTGSNFSGGSFKTGNLPECELTVRFSGTAIDLIGFKGAHYGQAWVTLDGGTPQLVDFYSSSYIGKQLIWSQSGLTDTTHEVRIQYAGLKNSASSGYTINLDAVDVIGTLLQAPVYAVRYEQNNSLISYGGAWTTSTGTNYSGGSFAYAPSGPAGFTVSFTGTAIDILGFKGAHYGQAWLTLDGGTPELIDFYNPTYVGRQLIWSKGDLANTAHEVRVEWAGQKDPSATGYTINLDAVEIKGTLAQAPPRATRYEQNRSLMSYGGVWTSATSSSSFSGGTLAVANAPGSEVLIRFNGTAVDLIGYKGAHYGKAYVTLDGGAPQLVDFYSSAYIGKQLIWSATGLANTNHDLRVEWSGEKNAASTGYSIDVDAVDIIGALVQAPPVRTRYEQDSSLISYGGSWTPASSGSSFSGGTIAVANSTGSGTAIRFTGTAVELIGYKGAHYGKAWVTLDGGTPQLIDFYSSTYVGKQIVWSAGRLANTTHDVRIDWSGQKNAAASGYSIDLDAVDVAGTLTQAPPLAIRYEQTDSKMAYSGSWTTANSASSFSGGSLATANTAGSRVDIRFSGTMIDLIGYKGPHYGKAWVTLDGGSPQLIDFYSSTYTGKQIVWSATGLADTTHDVRIEWSGEKNVASTGYMINLDAADIPGPLLQAAP